MPENKLTVREMRTEQAVHEVGSTIYVPLSTEIDMLQLDSEYDFLGF